MQQRPKAALPFLLASLLVLSSCATTALWNGDSDNVIDEEGESFHLEPEVDGVAELLVKIVLTPFTLAFDICTSPLQALFLFGDADPLIETLGGDTGDDCD